MVFGKCCNLFNKQNHKVANPNKLRKVTTLEVEYAKLLNINITANEMLICTTCRPDLRRRRNQHLRDMEVVVGDNEQIGASSENIIPVGGDEKGYHSSCESTLTTNTCDEQSVASSQNSIDKEDFVRNLNKLLVLIGVEEIDFRKITRSHSYCRNKMDEISKNLGEKIFNITVHNVEEPHNKNSDDKETLLQLKSKFAETANREEKWKILSLLPQSWTAYKVSSEFNVSWALANNVKNLVKDNGIMCGPKKRITSNVIHPNVLKLVQDFYLSEEISHTCPGKRDYVTINDDNEKITYQRRLLLMNLDEAYAVFKQTHIAAKIGFSKFASLRPPQCILALETFGTHSVCVCTYHQNVKLIFDGLKKILHMESYRELFTNMICSNPSEKCHLNQCRQCPSINDMEVFLGDMLRGNFLDNISFKQWVNRNGKSYSQSKV